MPIGTVTLVTPVGVGILLMVFPQNVAEGKRFSYVLKNPEKLLKKVNSINAQLSLQKY